MTLDEVIEKYTNNAEYERQNGNLQGCLDFRQLAEWLKDYKRLLEQEPCRVKNELNVELNELKPCDDAISREMALKECHDIVVDGERYRVIQEETLLGLPPVTPSCDKCAMNGSGSKYCDNCKQKSGKWQKYEGLSKLSTEEVVICNQCAFVTYKDNYYKYCPNCGAKMESEE